MCQSDRRGDPFASHTAVTPARTGFGGDSEQSEEELRASEERLRLVFEFAPDAYFLFDFEGRFLDCNRAATALVGYSREEMIGRTYRDLGLLAPEDLAQAAAGLAKCSRGEAVGPDDYTLHRKDGSRVAVAMRVVPTVIRGLAVVLGIARDMTASKRAEVALRESEERYRSLVELSPDLMAIHQDGVIVYVNAAGARLLGASSPAELVGRPAINLVHPAQRAAVLRRIRAVLAQGQSAPPAEETFVRLDGSPIEVEVSAVPITYGGRPAVQVIARDTGERKRAERALQEYAQQWRTTFDAIGDGAMLLDGDGRIRRCNQAWIDLVGKPREEILGRRCHELVHGTDQPMPNCPLVRVRETGRKQTEELHWQGRWFEVRIDPVLGAGGDVVGAVEIVADITGRKQAQDATRRRLALQEAMASASRLLVVDTPNALHDALAAVGKAARANRAYVFRLREHGAKMDNTHEWCAPGTNPAITMLQGLDSATFPWWMSVLERNEAVVIGNVAALPPEAAAEREILEAQGIRSLIVVPLHSGEGLLGFIGFDDTEQCRDWQEDEVALLRLLADTVVAYLQRQEATRALRESEQRFRAIVESTTDCILLWDRDYNYLYANRAAIEHVNTTPDKVVGRSMREGLGHIPDFMELWMRRVDEVVAAGEPVRVSDAVPVAGRVVHSESSLSPIKDAEGRTVAVAVVYRDVSERVRLEAELRQAQRMDAVGHLAAGVAHDFNNALMPIMTYSDLMLGRLHARDPLRQHAERIAEAAESAANLPRQLLAFSRKQVLQPKVICLNDIVEGMARMLRRVLGEQVEVVSRLSPTLAAVKADPGQIEQVLMNLAVNARDAMPDGGRLTIETMETELDEAYCHLHLNVTPGRYVVLAVSDTGCGMDRQTQERAFEPFFTTKEQGKGTGLGLSTVYGIVTQSGGHVRVYSEPGRGSTFRIYLPAVVEPIASGQRLAPASPQSGSETVLVAEDEPVVRQGISDMLEAYGYTVLDAEDGEDALRRAEAHPGAIHLLLTDVIMPGTGGRDLAERLLVLRPDVRVIFMSGYTEDLTVHQGVLSSGVGFLQKPFTPGVLTRKIREVLDQAPVRGPSRAARLR